MIKECGEKEKGERRFLLLFKLKELLYDIGNMAWVEGHILESENLELRHTVQDIVQDGNRDRVARILDKAHCIVTEALYPYTSRELYLKWRDDRPERRHVFGILLRVPDDFSQTTMNLMEHLVHEYMVADVMQDWLTITHADKAAVWLEKREEALSRLRSCVNLRRGAQRVRRRLSPF
ncbi:MAG: hypothetical protein K1V77_06590 [Muribaculaceae bacterium]